MREIVLDTETTGLDPVQGHRVVEIGAVELINKVASGPRFHVYLNPERDMPEEAFRVHGLSETFLADKPVFSKIAGDFIAFIGTDPLVIHNAEFDLKFLNHELSVLGLPPIGTNRVIDTLALARRRHANASNSLDALCARYNIDASRRTLHGALLDAQLLAEVYLELSGGSQSTFELHVAAQVRPALVLDLLSLRLAELSLVVLEHERLAHDALVQTLGPSAIWNFYRQQAGAPN
jgi:DNA polymerase-3 subunit epsilon